MITKTTNPVAPRGNIQDLTAEQLQELFARKPELMQAYRNLEAQQVEDLKKQLIQKFGECEQLADQIKDLSKEPYSPPWSRSPQQCAYDIEKFMKQQPENKAAGSEILAHMEVNHPEYGDDQVQETLDRRKQGNKEGVKPLWTHDDSDTYTLIPKQKKKKTETQNN